MKLSFKPGDHVSFSYKGNEVEGTILNEEHGRLVVKLSSGYNISVTPADLKDAKKTDGKEKAAKKPVTNISVDEREEKHGRSDLPKIAILHTGGTIASRVDYETGAVVAKFTAEEILALVPELEELARVSSVLVRNMQSDDMRFAHWNLIAEAVAKAVEKGVAGVIVTHGTDTLHYTAAALGFMLENLPVPVVLVGSQRSSDRGSSDGPSNLVAATRFILAAKERPGVYTCLHGSMSDDAFFVIDGFHSRKLHSTRRDAFRPVNAAATATVKNNAVVFHAKPKLAPSKKLVVKPFKSDVNVSMVFFHPNFFAKDLEHFTEHDGLVIMATGLGHLPITRVDDECDEHPKILAAVEKLAKKMPVAITTQTIYGRVNLDVYSPGRALQATGVLGQGLDMMPETAFVKLAWLLSNYDEKQVRELYGRNLRGELSERSEEDGFVPE